MADEGIHTWLKNIATRVHNAATAATQDLGSLRQRKSKRSSNRRSWRSQAPGKLIANLKELLAQALAIHGSAGHRLAQAGDHRRDRQLVSVAPLRRDGKSKDSLLVQRASDRIHPPSKRARDGVPAQHRPEGQPAAFASIFAILAGGPGVPS